MADTEKTQLVDDGTARVLVYKGDKIGFQVNGYPPPMSHGDRRLITVEEAETNGCTPQQACEFIMGLYNRGCEAFEMEAPGPAEQAALAADKAAYDEGAASLAAAAASASPPAPAGPGEGTAATVPTASGRRSRNNQ